MSAWIVDRAHIDLMVTAGLDFSGQHLSLRWWWDNPLRSDELTPLNADAVGRMLWAENLASVAARYPADKSGERPGPSGFRDEDVESYRFDSIPGRIDPVVVLKSIDCYEYQSCEHKGWRTSEAHAFCDALRKAAIGRLTGYGDAPWGFDDRRLFVPQRVK